MSTSMQQRRGTAEQWAVGNPILRDGEIGIDKDSGIIKIGDGGTAWANLPVALESQYLDILGKAADADKLDGFDASTGTTANTVAVRNAEGRLSAIRASGTGELTTLGQTNELVAASRLEILSRTVTASAALTGGDVYNLVMVNGATTGAQISLPADASENIPIGAWVDILNVGANPIEIVPASGVTFDRFYYMKFMLFRGDTMRVLKTSANTYVPIDGVLDSGFISARPYISSSWNIGGDNAQLRMRNGSVDLSYHVVNNTGATVAAGSVFSTLPVGWRPQQMHWPVALKFGAVSGEFKIRPDGGISLGVNIENGSGLVGSTMFLAG